MVEEWKFTLAIVGGIFVTILHIGLWRHYAALQAKYSTACRKLNHAKGFCHCRDHYHCIAKVACEALGLDHESEMLAPADVGRAIKKMNATLATIREAVAK